VSNAKHDRLLPSPLQARPPSWHAPGNPAPADEAEEIRELLAHYLVVAEAQSASATSAMLNSGRRRL
jgi:hypothetical protein